MFTGIIEGLAPVVAFGKAGDCTRISIDLGSSVSDTKVGNSISVNGVCLTVSGLSRTIASFDVMNETLERSNLKFLDLKDSVNIERSLRLSDRLGGHLIYGHVDDVGAVDAISKDAGYLKMWIRVSAELARMMVRKGAVAVDGVSMTVVDVEVERFSVAIIPHTESSTTLGSRRVGELVNIEVDMIGRYVKKFLDEINAEA